MLLEQIKDSLNKYSFEELCLIHKDTKNFYKMNLEIFKQYAYVISSEVDQLSFYPDMTYDEIMAYLPEEDKVKLERIRNILISEISEEIFINETKQLNKEV